MCKGDVLKRDMGNDLTIMWFTYPDTSTEEREAARKHVLEVYGTKWWLEMCTHTEEKKRDLIEIFRQFPN